MSTPHPPAQLLRSPLSEEAMHLMQTIAFLVAKDLPAHLVQVPSRRFKDGVPTLFTADREGDNLVLMPLCVLATKEMWRGIDADPRFPMVIPMQKQETTATKERAGKAMGGGLVLPGQPGFEQAKRAAGEK